MNEICIRPLAEEDLYSIWSYIAEENADTLIADRFIRNLNEQFLSLLDSPHLGRSLGEIFPGMRKLVFGNYLIFYTLREFQVEIVRVLHGARNWESLL